MVSDICVPIVDRPAEKLNSFFSMNTCVLDLLIYYTPGVVNSFEAMSDNC
jgi:hypothetical protein